MIRFYAFIFCLYPLMSSAAPEDVNPVYQIHFSQEEILHHQRNIDQIIEVSASCLDETYQEHLDFFGRHGISKFYGDRREQHQTRAGLLSELSRFGKSQQLISELEPMSCIGLTLRCLGRGFSSVGADSTWQTIMRFLKIDNKVYGTDLQILLQKLGWELIYWNPNSKNNERWDEEDKELAPLKPGKKWNPLWGGHSHRHSTVMTRGIYYHSYVDEKSLLLDFGTQVPQEFQQVPFFVGIAHADYHVFPGRYGEVIEAHSTRELNDIENLEFSPFNPLASGGGPRWTRTEKYRSGLIAVPPKALD